MLNHLSSFIYFIINVPIIVYVGWKCFTSGRIYLLDLFSDIKVCDSVNKILLVGYYLINIGYVAFSISEGLNADNLEKFLVSILTKTSKILLMIAIMHYLNIFLLNHFRKQILLTFKS